MSPELRKYLEKYLQTNIKAEQEKYEAELDGLRREKDKLERKRKKPRMYRNRQTLAFCKEHGIRLSGPALGKPSKNPVLSRQAKKQEYQDSCDRN